MANPLLTRLYKPVKDEDRRTLAPSSKVHLLYLLTVIVGAGRLWLCFVFTSTFAAVSYRIVAYSCHVSLYLLHKLTTLFQNNNLILIFYSSLCRLEKHNEL
jgi:hypothetical protein